MPNKTNIPKAKSRSKTPIFTVPKGMHDVLPQEEPWWERIRKAVEELASFYNFSRLETPMLESAELFTRGMGEEAETIMKEMFTVKTKGGDLLALRPDWTAAAARAYLEHGLGRLGQPIKIFTEGPMFRHGNLQKGDLRQFSQANFEIMGGPNDPIYDAQIILLFDRLLKALKIAKPSLKMNSIGCRVCRPFYRRQLQSYYRRYETQLCGDCVRRLGPNPLRLLDCRKESCAPFKAQAPNFLDKICAGCSHHFQAVLEYLDELKIPYTLDNYLIRGLDYYSRTVFEIMTEGVGSEAGTLVGGGRYDYLFEVLGGRLLSAVGGAAGFERLVHVIKAQEIKLPAKGNRKIMVIYVSDQAKKKSLPLIEELRVEGFMATDALGKESLKAQLKVADKEGYPVALIIGQKEVYEETVIVRDLRSSLQETVARHRMVDEIRKRLKDK